MNVVVDRIRCQGMGMCESFSPEIFEVDDDGELILHTVEVTECARSEIEQAVQACPTQALSVEE